MLNADYTMFNLSALIVPFSYMMFLQQVIKVPFDIRLEESDMKCRLYLSISDIFAIYCKQSDFLVYLQELFDLLSIDQRATPFLLCDMFTDDELTIHYKYSTSNPTENCPTGLSATLTLICDTREPVNG